MSIKFLIVDDSMAMRTIVKRVLSDAGYADHKFKFAENGKQALEYIINWQPEIVLLDLHMPEMSGLEVLAKVNELQLSTKIGLITAENNKQMIAEATTAGAAFVVHKPFETESIKTALQKVIQGQTSSTVPVATSLPTILFPTASAVATLINAVTSVSCLLKAEKSVPLEQLKLPANLALLGNSDNKIKAILMLDNEASDSLSEIFAASLFSQEAFDDKLLTKAFERAMSILSTLFYNTSEYKELKLIKIFPLSSITDNVRFIDKVDSDKRADFELSIDSRVAGKLSFIAQSIS